MFKLLITDKRFQFFNGLLIAVSAALLCKETFILTHVAYKGYTIYTLVFTTTLYAYLDYGNEKKLTAKLFEQLITFKKIVGNPFFDILVGGSLLHFFLFHSMQSFFILLIIGTLSCFYFGTDFFSKRFNIRTIYFAKTFILAMVWSITTVILPLSFADEKLFSTVSIFVFARRFFFIAALTIPFEIRDIHKDAALGYKSFVHLLGVAQSKLLALLLLSIFLSLIYFQYLMQTLELKTALALFFSFAISAALISIYQNEKKSAGIILLFLDAMLLLPFLLIELSLHIRI